MKINNKEAKKDYKEFKKEGIKALKLEIVLSPEGIANCTEANGKIFNSEELSPIVAEFTEKIKALIDKKLKGDD